MSDDLSAMAKTYDPRTIESKWYQHWEQAGYFAVRNDAKPYCIVIPPPNVTGTLHMGHAFQDTLMDILIRYHRMCGDATLWQPGMDHAGIATQMVVERQLNAQGKTRHDLGREAFVKRVWQWKEESGGNILRQLRRLGASADWSRERFTMDEGLSAAVREIFVRLYDEGLIYRGKRLVNWDPVLKTAISDLEVENVEEQGEMFYVRYPFAAGQGLDGQFLLVATTRPETMFADVAVAVHPKDERFQSFVGKKVDIPLAGRSIPVVADDYVSMDFGTGCLKITPGHDFNDYAVGKRHQLPMINILTDEARLNDEVPAAYRGMDCPTARRKVVEDLKSSGFLAHVEPHSMTRPRGDRSGVVIEPYLTDQWFVDLTRETLDDGRPGGLQRLTRPAIEAVEQGRVRFIPDNWKNTYYEWMYHLEDWCISRQLWWGHRIPAWYDEQGNIYVARDEAEVRQKYALAADLPLRQDDDVLDTWFSSALWPFSTLGWPEQTPELAKFYPSSVLVTGFDIIFFWVARMILFGMYSMGEVPFHDVYVHGLVRDSNGKKMSKSKGNIIDPLDIVDGIDAESLIRKRTYGMMQPEMKDSIIAQTQKEFPDGIQGYGTDALRFSFVSLATTGRDVVFDLQRTEGFRNFCNKIWNAARFVLMQCEQAEIHADRHQWSAAEYWISARLAQTIDDVEQAFAQYRFDFAASALYDFFWHDYCDWYLELVKPVLYQNDNEAQKAALRHHLLHVLESALRLIHPIMPFISEEIWQQIAPLCGQKHQESIMLSAFPRADEFRFEAARHEQAAAEIAWLQECTLGIRKIRADMNLSPAKKLRVLLAGGSAEQHEYLARQGNILMKIARLEELSVLDGAEPQSAAFFIGSMKILLPFAGLIDRDAELKRLDKSCEALRQNIRKLEAQMNNARFVEQAPAALVEQTRKRLQQDQENLRQISEQRAKIASL